MPWALLTHDDSIEALEDVLLKLYGVVPPNLKECSSLISYYNKVCDACKNLGNQWSNVSGITDENYFLFTSTPTNTHKLDYLVIDTLFHVRKQELAKDSYTSSTRFFEDSIRLLSSLKEAQKSMGGATMSKPEISESQKTNDQEEKKVVPSPAHMTKNFQDLWDSQPNRWISLFGISRSNTDLSEGNTTNYQIPSFLKDYLVLSLHTIVKNPLSTLGGEEISNHKLKRFLSYYYPAWAKALELHAQDDMASESNINNEIDQVLTLYVMERTHDVESMAFLVQNQVQHLDFETVRDAFLPMYFVPNPLAKREYMRVLFDVLSEERVISTGFDWWEDGKDLIAQVTPTATPAQTVATNLKHVEEYLRYLATVYYPVLSACFYVGFKKKYPRSEDLQQAKNELLGYIRDQKVTEKYRDQIGRLSGAAKYFDTADLVLARKYYTRLRQEAWLPDSPVEKWATEMQINFVDADNKYQRAMLQAVIRAKVQNDGDPDPVFPSDKKTAEALYTLWDVLMDPRISDRMTELKNLFNKNGG